MKDWKIRLALICLGVTGIIVVTALLERNKLQSYWGQQIIPNSMATKRSSDVGGIFYWDEYQKSKEGFTLIVSIPRGVIWKDMPIIIEIRNCTKEELYLPRINELSPFHVWLFTKGNVSERLIHLTRIVRDPYRESHPKPPKPSGSAFDLPAIHPGGAYKILIYLSYYFHLSDYADHKLAVAFTKWCVPDDEAWVAALKIEDIPISICDP